ncbi:hypothetical protein OUZ56_003723 [Daphnia magna]|uniref:Uncharacterized protein n=1 Tax=Daphnia magna TaxID=35525 RepID=A0ABR0A9J5_9CRUS|nr:hypothetical protein OUZ56_003723 [Daphnia magna]
MNPIENVWVDIVKDSEFFHPRSADEVFEKANAIWEGYNSHNFLMVKASVLHSGDPVNIKLFIKMY